MYIPVLTTYKDEAHTHVYTHTAVLEALYSILKLAGESA